MTSPPRIAQQVTFISVSDLERSGRFYEDDLALPLVLDQGSCRIYRVAGTGFLGICAGAPAPEGIIVTLVTEEVEEWYEHLTARGVETEAPPKENERYRIVHFFARDPDGYRVEVQRFLDPAWPTP